MAPTIIELPTEILQQVATEWFNAHQPSFYALTRTSKMIHAAVARMAVHAITLHFRTKDHLYRDIRQWHRILSRVGGWSRVPRLLISGGFWDDRDPIREEQDDESEMYYSRPRHRTRDAGGPLDDSPEQLAVWDPLVKFLYALQYLLDLVWDCHEPFPPAMLDALHEHLPNCRLSIETFQRWSLREDVIRPYTMALATSPSLFSITLHDVNCDESGIKDENFDAVMYMVSGLTPNLKEVCVAEYVLDDPMDLQDGPPSDVQPKLWKGFPELDAVVTRRGSLTNLCLSGLGPISTSDLMTCEQHIDSTALSHLSLTVSAGADDKAMLWAVKNCSFPNLRSLDMILMSYFDETEHLELLNQVSTFILNISLLQRLLLRGNLEPAILECALHRHGGSLTELHLGHSIPSHLGWGTRTESFNMAMYWDNAVFALIQSSGPLLHTLSLFMNRQVSGPAEVKAYKTLGRMQSLRHLHLRLHCSRPDSELLDARADLPDGAIHTASLKSLEDLESNPLASTLFNMAVDETLARSIWATIQCASRSGRQLQSLELSSDNAHRLYDFTASIVNEIASVFRHISRCYMVEKNPLPGGDAVMVRESKKRIREANDAFARELLHDPEREHPPTPVMELFCRMWPAKEGDRDWLDHDWASLPLREYA